MPEGPAVTQGADSTQRNSERPDLLGPLALVVVTLVIWLAFQTSQIMSERAALQTASASQETTIQEAQKIRAQLDSIARRTAELAARGNQGAQAIVDDLRKRGVTINPTPPATPGK